ncbi:MAG: hypothetical protein ACO1SV_02750 [Fimbriimonas sp.]
MKDDRLIYVCTMGGFTMRGSTNLGPIRGETNDATMALALGRALHLLGDTIPRMIVTDQTDMPWAQAYHHVVPREGRSWLNALEHTEANRVLFLHPFMLPFKRLDDIFAWCQGKTVCMPEDLEIGLIYYERPFDEAQWRDATPSRSGAWVDGLRAHPEAWTPIPASLQFQSGLTGWVSEFEMDITRGRCRAVCEGKYTEPYLFRAGDSRHASAYREQIRRLDKLAEYERTHERGYHSPGLKFRRSVERRLLRWRLGFKV